MAHDTFSEQLRRFKEKENPETVLIVADDPQLMKIVVAWTSLEVCPTEGPSQPAGESEHDVWNWLWSNTSYSIQDLSEKCSLSSHLVERKLKPLIGNRVLYPDGSVNSFVQRYLRERVLKLFESRARSARGA